MRVKEILTLGARTVYYNKKFVVLFWGMNALGALILTLPVYYILADNLNHSVLGHKLLNEYDFSWLLQIKYLYSKNIGQFPYLLYVLTGIYLLVQNFFIGGLISVFHNPQKNHMVDFFYGGVKYWLRFTRLLVVILILFFLVFKLNDYFGNLIGWYYADVENEMGDFLTRSFRYLLLIFIIGVLTVISDYTKISLVVNDRTKVLQELLGTLKITSRNFYKIFSVFLIVAVIGAVGAVFYNLIGIVIPTKPYYYLILLFVVRQMLIIFRLLIKMLFYSTEILLYKDLTAQVVEVKTEEKEEIK